MTSTPIAWLRHNLSHEATPFVQFIKYALAGGVATLVHILTFFLVGFFLFPCVTQEDILTRLLHLTAPTVAECLRAKYAALSNLCAFFLSNSVCYLMNRLFVFTPGRHAPFVEFFLFFAVSALSVAIGTLLMGLLIRHFAIQTTLAFGANLLSSLAINYAMRKFFVFNG